MKFDIKFMKHIEFKKNLRKICVNSKARCTLFANMTNKGRNYFFAE